MSNDYGSGYRDGKRYAQFEVHVEIQKKQKEIDLLVEALMKEKREIARLRAGGCARDQGSTQFCAEAVALQKENDLLREALQTFVRQWNACGLNSDFGRYFANVRKQAVAALGEEE